MIKKQMTDHEWETIYKMTKDKSLYQNLITSIFPTIHGKRQIIKVRLLTTINRADCRIMRLCILHKSFAHSIH